MDFLVLLFGFQFLEGMMCMEDLLAHKEEINRLMARYGVKFGIYKNGTFKERLFPFDPIPRAYCLFCMTICAFLPVPLIV